MQYPSQLTHLHHPHLLLTKQLLTQQGYEDNGNDKVDENYFNDSQNFITFSIKKLYKDNDNMNRLTIMPQKQLWIILAYLELRVPIFVNTILNNLFDDEGDKLISTPTNVISYYIKEL
ncbi:unnamed protein product [Cunninghamella echinulata]